MNLLLTRNSNDYCYLYGDIYEEEEYICDTLEFGSAVCLPAGVYYLSIGHDQTKNIQVVQITDLLNNIVSKFVTDNTIMYNYIRIRNENNYICIGTKINQSLLAMSEYTTRMFMHKIKHALLNREIIRMTIAEAPKHITPFNNVV